MLINDIVVHLMEYLPRMSDSFTDYVTPDAVTLVDGLVTVSCSSHLLHDDDYVCITHARIKNDVASSVYENGVLKCAMTDVHDFTYGWQTTALLKSDLDDSINGEYTIASVDGNVIGLSGAPSTIPADAYIAEMRDVSINGIFKAENATTSGFTFTIPYNISRTIDASTVRIHNKMRITGAASIDRFIASYEKEPVDKLWCVVTRGRNAVSKSASTATDFSNEQTGYTSWEVYMSAPFTINVVSPVYGLTAIHELNYIESERAKIYSSILGVKFDSGFSSTAAGGVSPDDDSPIQYDKTKLVVPFNFYQLNQITNDDVTVMSKTSAFNGLNIDFLSTQQDNENIIMSLSISWNDGD